MAMKGYVYDSCAPEGIRLADLPLPSLATLPRDHCLVAVKACGMNPGDAKRKVDDKLPWWLAPLGHWWIQGMGVGFDFAGVVTEVGPDAAAYFARGDRVYGCTPEVIGSFAQYITCPYHQMGKIPKAPGEPTVTVQGEAGARGAEPQEHVTDGTSTAGTRELTYVEAAAMPLVSITAVQAFRDHGLRRGQAVAVIGASGGVGSVATQIAKATVGDTGLVVGVCSKRNKAVCLAQGCDEVVSYDECSGLAHVTGALWDVLRRRRGGAVDAGTSNGAPDATASASTDRVAPSAGGGDAKPASDAQRIEGEEDDDGRRVGDTAAGGCSGSGVCAGNGTSTSTPTPTREAGGGGVAPFDLILDCVTSNAAEDHAAGYPYALLSAELVKAEANGPGTLWNYITIGGPSTDWCKALIRRWTGWNLFALWGRCTAVSSRRELFWIRFPHSGAAGTAPPSWHRGCGGAALRAVSDHITSGALKVPRITRVDDAMRGGGEGRVRNACRELLGRRVCGKLVIVP